MCVETDALLRVGPFIIVRRYNYIAPKKVTGAKPRVGLRFRRADRDSV